MKGKLFNSIWAPLWSKATKGNESFALRSFVDKVIKHGRQRWNDVLEVQTGSLLPKNIPFRRVPVPRHVGIRKPQAPISKPSLSRQVFTSVFPRVAMQSIAAEWRRRTAVQLISGGLWRGARNSPLFAFVGVVVSKQQEKENLFAQIRDLHAVKSDSSPAYEDEQCYCLGSLDLGQLIATGCNAAVYEARLVNSTDDDITILSEPADSEDGCSIDSTDSSVELAAVEAEEYSDSDVSILDMEQGSDLDVSVVDESHCLGEEPAELLLPLQLGHGVRGKQGHASEVIANKDYDMAVKMMFNYDIESNAEAVLAAMEKEALPVCMPSAYSQHDRWHNGNRVKKKAAPPHPNIVWMYGVFVDSVPDLPSNTEHYPAALPSRLYPDGLGRNSTMFLVMKRYTCTLTQYLSRETPSVETCCLLLCQLLEGIIYLQQQGLAHRDLKSDNLLLDLSAGSEYPVLVISDFGCCLRSEDNLQIAYTTSEISKGGNAALMAPEIACAKPGARSVLDYTKSDLWASGVLTYEIFGMENPFYRSRSRSSRLDSRTYTEQELPELPGDTPTVIKALTRNLLCRDPLKRVSTAVAGTVLQLYLWGPAEWWQSGAPSLHINTIQDWMVSMAAWLACQNNSSKHTDVIHTIRQTFLSRISYKDLESAVIFLQT